MLLMHSLDYPAVAQRRIENYQILADKMNNLALFPKLPSYTVPLGFPICVERRDEVRQILFDHKIYPSVHWPIRSIVPEEFKDSHKLASEIMTLPCDQRYNSDDMCRIAELILEEVKK
jgi:dTDP-4-amino-4,6-dideoxygalactose transaminase